MPSGRELFMSSHRPFTLIDPPRFDTLIAQC